MNFFTRDDSNNILSIKSSNLEYSGMVVNFTTIMKIAGNCAEPTSQYFDIEFINNYYIPKIPCFNFRV